MPQVEPWYPAGPSPDTPRSPANGLSPASDEIVQIVDAGNGKKDVYISCCDAIGLGCMVVRWTSLPPPNRPLSRFANTTRALPRDRPGPLSIST